MQKILPISTITVPVPDRDELRIGTLQCNSKGNGRKRNERIKLLSHTRSPPTGSGSLELTGSAENRKTG
jgi:hypothetical protein